MNSGRTKKITVGITLLVSLIWLTSIVYLGLTSPIVYDEAFFFHNHVQNLFTLEPQDPLNINTLANHPLYSVTASGIHRVAPWNEGALRVPSIVAAFLYTVAAWLLAFRSFRWPTNVLCVSLLLSSALPLGFFTLARGYSLGLAFELLALVCLAELRNKQMSNAGSAIFLLLCVFLTLSVWSNFSFIYSSSLIAVAGLVFWIPGFVSSGAYTSAKNYWAPALGIVVLASNLAVPGQVSKAMAGDPHKISGPDGDFFSNISAILGSQIESWSFLGRINTPTELAIVITAIVLVLSLFVTLTHRRLPVFPSLFLGSLVLPFIALHWFDSPHFPFHRMSLFVYPLFCLTISCLVQRFVSNLDRKTVTTGTLSLAFLLLANAMLAVGYIRISDTRWQAGMMVFGNAVDSFESHVLNESQNEDLELCLEKSWLVGKYYDRKAQFHDRGYRVSHDLDDDCTHVLSCIDAETSGQCWIRDVYGRRIAVVPS